ncbi:MAG: hypothetical protein R6U51_06255 [Anaerolineales bacterium]
MFRAKQILSRCGFLANYYLGLENLDTGHFAVAAGVYTILVYGFFQRIADLGIFL